MAYAKIFISSSLLKKKCFSSVCLRYKIEFRFSLKSTLIIFYKPYYEYKNIIEVCYFKKGNQVKSRYVLEKLVISFFFFFLKARCSGLWFCTSNHVKGMKTN